MNTLKYGEWAFENETRDGPCILIGYIYIPVCSFAHPIVGKYLISRRTEGWQLAPVIYDRSGHGRMVVGMQFTLLTNSPDLVNDEIALALIPARSTGAP